VVGPGFEALSELTRCLRKVLKYSDWGEGGGSPASATAEVDPSGNASLERVVADPGARILISDDGPSNGARDLADPGKSLFMIATGESGHIFSPDYRGLDPLWNDVKSITLTGSEDDLKTSGARELILSP
jgi:hypothetical protein